MRIRLVSVLVDDQEKALNFYTEKLGFVKKQDQQIGEARWLTVVSAEEPDGPELVLEPQDNPASKAFTQAIHSQGIPFTAFLVEDVQREHERLSGLGVTFTLPPTGMGEVTAAILDDTCGNLIQIYSM